MPTEAKGEGHGLSLQQAIEEAHRCLLCHDAPCNQGCPGGTQPAKFIRQIRFYNFKGAARTVMQNNPLGGVCARVCPTEDTCVAACLREGLDRPIDIDGLQQFAVEYGRQHGLKPLRKGQQREEKVAVIGAGPAGLTAAARLAEFGYQVTLFEARAKAGGMLRYGVPQSRLTDQVLDADLAEILELGVTLKTDTKVSTENGAEELLREGYSAVFVAPGLWRPIALELEGSALEGVTTAVEFLQQCRRDEAAAKALVAGNNVAVIGGGSVAMDVTRCARELGAGRIYAIALESMTELPAMGDELHQAFADDVMIRPQSRVSKIVGAGGKVSAVEGVEIEWIEKGNPVPQNARVIDGSQFRIPVSVVVQAVGQAPTDSAGKIVAAANKQGSLLAADRETLATSVRGVYAGGDIVRGAATVVAAVGDGKRAAEAIHQQLGQGKEVA